MSQNVKTMCQMLKAFEREDRTAWLSFLDEDHIVVPNDGWPEPDIRGREAAWEFYFGVAEAFGEGLVVNADLEAVGLDKVLIRATMDGRASGAVAEPDLWIVVTFRNGKILREEWFTEPGGALEAAGLSEYLA
jgi:ketosteroid isomerase-like protein